MPLSELLTTRLHLRPFSDAAYVAAAVGDAALATHLGVPVASGWLDFPEALLFWQERLHEDPTVRPWALYGYFERSTGAMIGGGGFKGHPDAAGQVEIGYGLAPEARGQGFATEGALALVGYAFAHPAVQRVMAHTQPTESPSARVLRRAGFTQVGEVLDPEDGLLWQWVRER